MTRQIDEHPVATDHPQSSNAIHNAILSALLDADGDYVSGNVLKEAVGVTRTAVWKHIQHLQQQGFIIESVHGKGYRLTSFPDILLEPLLARQLSPDVNLGRKVVWSESVASTNDLANMLAEAGAPHGTVVTARRQTGGKGRQRRPWFSPEGGLWLSIIMRHTYPLSRAGELPLITAVAVRRALASVCDLPVRIKWPNDLLCHGKKVCGILAEIRGEGEWVKQTVLGIGINLNIERERFPEELSHRATSILAESGKSVRFIETAAVLLEQVQSLCEQLTQNQGGFASVKKDWEAHSATLGSPVRVLAGTTLVEGTATSITDQGVLLVQSADGVCHRIHSGEVLF